MGELSRAEPDGAFSRRPGERAMRKVSLPVTSPCQLRAAATGADRRERPSLHVTRVTHVVTFVLAALAAVGCGGPEKKPKPAPTPTTSEPAPTPQPIETRRLHLGKPEVDRTTLTTPLTGEIEITTWSDQVHRGTLVEETAEGYVLDEVVPGGREPIRRTIPRKAVMTLRVLKP